MSYESEDKMVSHPDHYQSGKYAVIDIIEEFTKDLSGLEAVCTGNAIKYILRWKKKGGYQDLEKAMWYIQHMLDKHEEAEHKPSSVVIHKLADSGHYVVENKLEPFTNANDFPETDKLAKALAANEEVQNQPDNKELYCTECPYFEFTGDPDDNDWYGTRCNKDGHTCEGSMYAIESLHKECPLKEEKTDEQSITM